MQRLLCYGHDDMLLLTRKWILNEHFAVDTCCETGEMDGVLDAGPVALAIVCHTVLATEALQIAAVLRSSSPETMVLQLDKRGDAIATVHALARAVKVDCPVALLLQVHAMLSMPEDMFEETRIEPLGMEPLEIGCIP